MTTRAQGRRRRSIHRRRDPLALPMAVLGILVIALLLVPVVVVVVSSFNSGALLSSWGGLGTSAYVDAWNSQSVRDAVTVSLKAGVLASLMATLLGTLGGVALARWRSRLAPALAGLLALVLVAPEIVGAVAVLPWFDYLGQDLGVTWFDNGLVRLVVVHTTVALATVTFVVRARMSRLDPTLREAASDLYATRWNRFRQITFPLLRPAILAGALMAFTLSLDNTIVSSFVVLPGYTSWPVSLFGQAQGSPAPDVAAVATVLLATTLLALALVTFVLRRGGTRTLNQALTLP